jgi:3-phenylpropionate/trans-cinnamate dioxygenase ferredoxin reductase subunit
MTLVVVGGGLAGAKAAAGARDAGYDGAIVVVGDEAHPPYERPPLSKNVLRGEAAPESAHVNDAGWYAANDVTLRTGSPVTAIDVARRVVVAGGEELAYDALVIATGASPRRLGVPGADLAGVHYLRTLDDAVRLRDAIDTASRVAVVGAGWIGCEVAASARQKGREVVVVDPLAVPLHRVVGTEVGEVFAALHRDNGVRLRMGSGVASLRGTGTVDGVVLADGTVEEADCVVVGIGVVPNVELAAAAGIPVDNGVLVDATLATEVPRVWAAGDVANAWHPTLAKRLRVEHWANALNQGTTAGRNAAGAGETYDRLPYFYSDQYDLGLEYVGHGSADDDVTIRGDVGDRKFLAYWSRDGRVTAAMTVNVWDVVEDLKRAVGGPVPD